MATWHARLALCEQWRRRAALVAAVQAGCKSVAEHSDRLGHISRDSCICSNARLASNHVRLL